MFLLVFFILISHSSANSVFEFCVAELSQPRGPSGLVVRDNAKNLSSSISILHNVETSQFPGLNGMGISMAQQHLMVGGVVPIHTHRVCEVFHVHEGTILTGFIDTNNKAYYKTLNKGEIMIMPPTLMHFLVNVGSTPVLAFSTFASENRGTQVVNNAFYGGNLPSDLVEKITLLDPSLVHKFKKLFGGTN
ncbi:Auxin-binding protein ABP20 [Bienertia sinuspersici]